MMEKPTMLCPLRIMELADVHTGGDCDAMHKLLVQHPNFEEWYNGSMVAYLTRKHVVVVKDQLLDLLRRLGSFERAMTLYGLPMPALSDL
jgi:hypothetical protein